MGASGHRANSSIIKYAAALWAASFVFFLVYSAPHRVHHFFEQAPAASHNHAHDDHDQQKHDQKTPNSSDCVFQVSASRCAANLTEPVGMPAPIESLETFAAFIANSSPQSSVNTPFQIRAPPRV